MRNLTKTLFFICLLIISDQTFGQKIGAKGGLNLSNMMMKDDDDRGDEDFKMKAGIHLGAIVNIPLMDMVSLEPGIQISNKGYRTKQGDTKFKLNLIYFEIPVLGKFSYELGDITLVGLAGPVFGVGLSGKEKWNYDGDKESDKIEWGSDDDQARRPEVGLMFGAGVEMSSFQFTLSYNLGLTSVSNESNNGFKFKNRVIGLSAAYFFTEL